MRKTTTHIDPRFSLPLFLLASVALGSYLTFQLFCYLSWRYAALGLLAEVILIVYGAEYLLGLHDR